MNQDPYGIEYPIRREQTGKNPAFGTLMNIGETCYMNAILYVLRFTPGFTHQLHHLLNSTEATMNAMRHCVNQDILKEVHNVFKAMNEYESSHISTVKPYEPHKLQDLMGFKKEMQHDAQEFFMNLIQKYELCVESLAIGFPDYPNIKEIRKIGDIFKTKVFSEIFCTKCKNKTYADMVDMSNLIVNLDITRRKVHEDFIKVSCYH